LAFDFYFSDGRFVFSHLQSCFGSGFFCTSFAFRPSSTLDGSCLILIRTQRPPVFAVKLRPLPFGLFQLRFFSRIYRRSVDFIALFFPLRGVVGQALFFCERVSSSRANSASSGDCVISLNMSASPQAMVGFGASVLLSKFLLFREESPLPSLSLTSARDEPNRHAMF